MPSSTTTTTTPKKIARRQVKRVNGKLVVVYIDVTTGQVITDLTGYTLEPDTSQGTGTTTPTPTPTPTTETGGNSGSSSNADSFDWSGFANRPGGSKGSGDMLGDIGKTMGGFVDGAINLIDMIGGAATGKPSTQVPNATGPVTDVTGSMQPSLGVGGAKDGAEEVKAYLASEMAKAGYPPVAIAAALAHAENESSFNTRALGDGAKTFGGKGASGLFQWNDRAPALIKFASDNKLDPQSKEAQVAFYLYELDNPKMEKASGTALKKATSLEQANLAMTQYERFGGWNTSAGAKERTERLRAASGYLPQVDGYVQSGNQLGDVAGVTEAGLTPANQLPGFGVPDTSIPNPLAQSSPAIPPNLQSLVDRYNTLPGAVPAKGISPANVAVDPSNGMTGDLLWDGENERFIDDYLVGPNSLQADTKRQILDTMPEWNNDKYALEDSLIRDEQYNGFMGKDPAIYGDPTLAAGLMTPTVSQPVGNQAIAANTVAPGSVPGVGSYTRANNVPGQVPGTGAYSAETVGAQDRPASVPKYTGTENPLLSLPMGDTKEISPYAGTPVDPMAKSMVDSFLDTINESLGSPTWDQKHDRGIITKFDDHPNLKSFVGDGSEATTAAGFGAITYGMWQQYAPKAGVKDFSLESQKKVMWAVASDNYATTTGRDLLADITSGNQDRMSSALVNSAKIWNTLPGGSNSSLSLPEANTLMATKAEQYLGKAAEASRGDIFQAGNGPIVAPLVNAFSAAKTTEPTPMNYLQKNAGASQTGFAAKKTSDIVSNSGVYTPTSLPFVAPSSSKTVSQQKSTSGGGSDSSSSGDSSYSAASAGSSFASKPAAVLPTQSTFASGAKSTSVASAPGPKSSTGQKVTTPTGSTITAGQKSAISSVSGKPSAANAGVSSTSSGTKKK